MKCITSLVLFLIAPVGLAQGVPNTFTAGTPARAAEVNENFTDLDTRLTTGENIVSQLFAECTSSEHVGPLEPFSKRHFSARTFSSLAC